MAIGILISEFAACITLEKERCCDKVDRFIELAI